MTEKGGVRTVIREFGNIRNDAQYSVIAGSNACLDSLQSVIPYSLD